MNIDRIIKKILKEQDEIKPEPLYTSNIVVRPKDAFANVDTFKDPDGYGFVIPKKMLLEPPKLYNKQSWVNWYSDLTNAREQFNLILKNNDKTYQKLCYDQQLTQIIQEFLKVRDKWIPKNIKNNKYNIDQSIIDQAIGIEQNFLSNKKTYRSSFTNQLNLRPSKNDLLDGTDYFFSVLQQWLKTTSIGSEVDLVKGDNKTHSKPPTIEYITLGHSDVTNPDGTVTFNKEVYATRWDWYIKKSEFCDTKGQWFTWYAIQGTFVNNLFEDSVNSFLIKKEEFIEWAKSFKYKVDESKLNNPVEFRACFHLEEGGVRRFGGFFSDSIEASDENFKKGTVWQCYGLKFPGNADLLGLTLQQDVAQEEGLFTDAIYVPGTLIDIPLSNLNVNSLGKAYKDMVASEDEGLSSVESAAYWFFKAWSFTTGNQIVNPSNFYNKLEVPIETPLNQYTGGMFNEEDFIGHTKISEDSVIYTIPQGGLSPYIPGAKKAKNGKYYIRFKSGDNQLSLYLPTASWWNDYGTMIYKITNDVKTNWYGTDTPSFGLVLSIKDSASLASVLDTQGDFGWSFKMSNEGRMFYGVKNNKVNYNENYYFPVNDFLESYDFNNVEQFDSRSEYGRFMESYWGIAAQVVVGIVLAVVCAPAAAEFGGLLLFSEGLLAAESRGAASVVAKFLVQEGAFTSSRLQIYLAILFELDVIGVPMALYYKSRGDDFGVALSLICCFLPLALETRAFGTFTKKIWMKPVATRLSNKIIGKGKSFFRQNMSAESLIKFVVEELEGREAMAFGELLRNLDELGEKGVKDIISNAEKRIAIITKENTEKLSKIMPSIRAQVEQIGVSFVTVTGGFVFGIPLARGLHNYWSAKGKVMDEKQKKNLEAGLKSMVDYFTKKYDNKVIERIKQDLAKSNSKLRIKDPDEWAQDFLESNEDLFDILCKKNGWQTLQPQADQQYNNYLVDFYNTNYNELLTIISNDLISLSEKIGIKIKGPGSGNLSSEEKTVSGDDGNEYKITKGSLYKTKKGDKNWVQITDEEEIKTIKEKYFKSEEKTDEFKTELTLIYNQYPCLNPENNLFEFLVGQKDPFYISFKVLSGTYKDREIFVIYDYDTDDVDTDFKVTYEDDNGYIMYFTDILKKEYNC